MIEFDDKDLRDLQDVDGIVLRDVHGQRVAIGKGFDYGNVFYFMHDYFKEYGEEDFAQQIGYEDATHMFKSWFSGIPLHESNVEIWVCMAFRGISADSLQDQEDEDAMDLFKSWYLEAEDHKLDQERGK